MDRPTKNAPTFIYSLLHPEEDKFIRGRLEEKGKIKEYQGIEIDEAIPEEAFDRLFAIDAIEPRSSCQGHNKDRPTFFIFRPDDDRFEQNIDAFTQCLNQYEDIICGYDVGNAGRFRIGVTSGYFYTPEEQEKFTRWWNLLPERIVGCLQSIGIK